jgi:Family of unknown function (DUF6152)
MGIRTLLLAGVVSVAALASPGSAFAHHSAVAQFDLNNPVTLKGTLTKLEWVNPHAWIYLTVKSADGKTDDWRVEAGSPVRMEKRGLKKDYLRPGTEVIIGGFRARDGSQTLAGWVIDFPARESAGQEASFALGR